MVIEDDVILQLVYRKFLGKYNVKVFTCSNIAEANSCFSENHIDLIISDYNLPDATSLDFLKLVKGRMEKMPMILITANDGIRAENPEIDDTVNALLFKPVSYNEFLGKLDYHLSLCA